VKNAVENWRKNLFMAQEVWQMVELCTNTAGSILERKLLLRNS
jgi:hypothetical protein